MADAIAVKMFGITMQKCSILNLELQALQNSCNILDLELQALQETITIS
jgi:hypothetical protein